MNARIILSIVALALGTTAAMLPQRKNSSIALNEQQLLQEILSNKSYISPDELADVLIQGDPSIRIIDVRPAGQFTDPIPRAINIPFDSVFSPNFLFYFDETDRKNVIYGANERQAVQVWMLMKQKGFAQNYLLKGGLAAWEQTILHPQLPSSTEPEEAFEAYQKRMAAQQYFTGAKSLPKVQVEPISPVQGRAKKKVQGGCS